MTSEKLRQIFRPSILKISLAIVILSLAFLIVSPALNKLHIIPCKLLMENSWSWCSVNPMGMSESTAYFGLGFMDYIYQVLYLVGFLILAYFLAGLAIYLYTTIVDKK